MEAGQPRLIKGLQSEYVPALWQGKNTSGFRAFGKNVVVEVDTCSTSSSGGILLTDEMVSRMTAVSTTGCIVHVGAEAFRRFDDGTTWIGHKPETGARIFFEMYSGQIQRGIDGKDYRIMDYRCIAGEVDLDNPDVVAAMEAFAADEEARQKAEADRQANTFAAPKLVASGPSSSINRKTRRAGKVGA